MKKLSFLFVFITSFGFSQQCSCEDNFNWLKKTFEENDAGFSYALEQKGENAYKTHNTKTLNSVKGIKQKEECISVLNNWLLFFRSGHLIIQGNGGQENQTEEEIIKRFSTWEKYKIEEATFEKYISKLNKPGYEGIWESKPYKIGVIKTEKDYVGFILEADGIYWRKNQVKFRIKNTKDNKKEATFYMRNHSVRNFTEVELLGNNHLKIGSITLKRLKPNFEVDKTIEEHYSLIKTPTPLIKELSHNTILFRIPSFSHSNKKSIDSLILANHDKLTSKKNLIIDIRNNGGGSDISYEKIIPYLYTNPIRTVGVKLLSTPLNNSRMEKFMKDPNWSDKDKKWAKESLEKLNKNMGEFVNLNDNIVKTKKLDTIYSFPQNVAILINKGNGSTAEQFLLAAKQSKKVKLFGTTTVGVLDISNMHLVDFPCKDLKLGYSISKSMRIPEMTIDDKGIQPDYYIHKSIPDHKWIQYTQQILEAK
ncbi:S41 family peptidase [Aquimarina algiphila]|uniref:S41 family peptidase n=1 Tax=Aquimarina algiphila TaxID=2047982 RepID=UPI0024931650|nr:S41 family peptidase [Aquimarina algiphila]